MLYNEGTLIPKSNGRGRRNLHTRGAHIDAAAIRNNQFISKTNHTNKAPSMSASNRKRKVTSKKKEKRKLCTSPVGDAARAMDE